MPPDVRPGHIYWVNIPPQHTVGSEQYKRRPYVIVSRLLFNSSSNTVVGVPLSTAGTGGNQPPYRIVIPSQEITRELGFSGEIKDSIAKVDQVRVLDKTRLENQMGQLSDTAFAAVGLGLAFLFDIR